jgi:histidinol-phosphatase (PHP family)
MICDYHIHTWFSGDAECSPTAIAETAVQKGLDEICLTDHIDFDYQEDPKLFDFDPDAYFEALTKLRRQFAGRLRIRIGVELGLQPHITEKNRSFLTSYPWDFVIGSSHVVDRQDPYYAPYWEGKTARDGMLRYFESILDNLAAFQDFDVYGHLDYILRYCPEPLKGHAYQMFPDVIDECLRQIIQLGKGIEVNTGGMRKPLGYTNPHPVILKRYRELGGEIVTVGSDAHVAGDIAHGFQHVQLLLLEAGFTHYTVFAERKPSFIRL